MNSSDDLVRFIGFVCLLLATISIVGAALSKITAHMAEKIWRLEHNDGEAETDLPPYSDNEQTY